MATYDVGGRSAIVTGAGSGIGRAIARLLAANGAAVLVTDINEAARRPWWTRSTLREARPRAWWAT